MPSVHTFRRIDANHAVSDQHLSHSLCQNMLIGYWVDHDRSPQARGKTWVPQNREILKMFLQFGSPETDAVRT
jgi:hypothetical protein